MCGCFSIELHLKSLDARLVYHQTDMAGIYEVTDSSNLQREHDLVILFDDLSLGIRSAIERAYRLEWKADYRSDLLPFRKVFIDCRYAFEIPSYDDGLSGLSLTKLIRLARFTASFVDSLPNT